MSGDGRVLSIFPKNSATEQRIMARSAKNRMTKELAEFIDFREWWFKNGPMDEPIPTKKGTMVHRHNIPKVIVALLAEMRPDEVDREKLLEIRTQLARLEGKVD